MSATHGALAVTPSRIQAYAGRTLDFLQVIEKTVDGLTDDCDLLSAMNDGVARMIQSLQAAFGEILLDPDGRVCDLLTKSGETMVRIHTVAVHKRQSAYLDHRLDDDDGVVEAYDSYLNNLNQLHESVDEMKEWILVHDALLEPAIGPTYQTADELFKAILEKP